MTRCWTWTRAKNGRGYGAVWHESRVQLIHRVAYEALVGPIPAGLELDHLCRNRACYNPAHLEPVTHAENVRRGSSGARMRNRTRCPQGHPYDETNTCHVQRSNGKKQRACRACKSASAKRRWAIKSEESK